MRRAVNYTWAAVFAVVAAGVVDAFVLRTGLLRRRVFWVSYGIFFVFQLVVNGVLTGLQVVRYNPKVIVGARLAWAPVEDIAFGFSLVTLTLSIWVWLERRQGSRPLS